MSNGKPVIYHNPRCSKSRETLQILTDHDIEPEIVDYLDEPPSPEELKRIIDLLGDDEIIEAICEYPALLQRPIVIAGERAVIGRPPSRVLELLA